MLWATLWRKLGRQPLKITQHNHVYALLKNPKTHEYDHVPLCLKFDTSGRPYFVQEIERSSYGNTTNKHSKQSRNHS